MHFPTDERARRRWASRLLQACLSTATLLPLALLAGCGDEPEPAPPAGQLTVRVERGVCIEPREPVSEGIPDAKIVQNLLIKDGEVPWQLIYGEGRVKKGKEREKGYDFQIIEPEDGRRELVFTGPFEPDSFDQIAVVLGCGGERNSISVRGELLSGERVLSKTEARSRIPRMGIMLLEFPGNHSLGKQISSIKLRLPGASVAKLDFIGIQLRQRAVVGDRLPWPGEPARMATVGTDARSCVTLSRDIPLVYRLTVPPAGELRFSVGTPKGIGRLGGRSLLTVQARPAASGEEADFPVSEEIYVQRPRSWQSAVVDLSSLAGQEVDLHFGLQTPPNFEEAAVLLEEPYAVQRAEPEQRDQPVLLFTSDTHRADHVGVAPDARAVSTPTLDRLAAEGAYFVDCYSSAQTTSPSHASLMTGVPPLINGVTANGYALADEAVTLAERFREAGYLTLAAVSVSHLSPHLSGLHQGFDRVSSPDIGQRDSEETWAILSRWLDELPTGAPVFVWLHVFDAHGPYEPPKDYWPEWDSDPRDPSLPELPERHGVHWSKMVRDPAYIEALYAGEVSYVDMRITEVLAHPRLEGVLTAITADHGEVLTSRDDREWFGHSELLRDTLSVPLFLHGPGVARGQRLEYGVQQIDVGRTLLDLMGLGAATFPGHNLLAPRDEAPRFVLGNKTRLASVRLGRWHLTLQLFPVPAEWNEPHQHPLELYDLEVDPGCLRDLEDAEPVVAARLREMLVEWLQEGGAERLAGQSRLDDEEVVAELEALGYAAAGEGAESELWNPECTCKHCVHYREQPGTSFDSSPLR